MSSLPNGNHAFSPHKRRIFETMDDGRAHTADKLQRRLDIGHVGSVTRTLYWMVRCGFAVGRGEFYKLTLKGRTAARNLDDGYDYVPG